MASRKGRKVTKSKGSRCCRAGPENILDMDALCRKYNEFCDPHQELKSYLSTNIIQKLLRESNGCAEYDKIYYSYDECFANFKRFLDVMNGTFDECGGAVDSERSLFSLFNDYHAYKGRGCETQAREIIENISKMLNKKTGDAKKRHMFDAEIAHMYNQLGPKFYHKAMVRYTSIMKWLLVEWGGINITKSFSLGAFSLKPDLLMNIWEKFDTDDPMRKKIILWSFQCGYLFSKLLQKGNIHILRSCLPDLRVSDTKMVNAVFKNVRDMMCFVARSGEEQFSGWSQAVMADTMKIYELIGPRSDRTCKLPDGLSPDDCMYKAIEASPDNPHVLYLVGRHFRQRASSAKQFKDAVTHLERAGTLCPSMHVVFHHLGLAYRSMWILDRHYREAQLYTNSEKRSGRGKSRDHKINNKRGGKSKTPSELCKTMNSGQQNVKYEADLPKGAEGGIRVNPYVPHLADSSAYEQRSHQGCCQPQDRGPSLESLIGRKHTHNPSKYSAIHAKDPPNPISGKLPKHYKEPDFFHRLRTNNPIEKVSLDNEYLVKSHENLSKANELVCGTSPRYLIDLARICISMNKDHEGVVKHFSEAQILLGDHKKDDVSAIDGAYMYEQWGLFIKQTKVVTKEKEEICLKDAKHLLLKSLYCSVLAKQRSRVAFYDLLDILEELAKESSEGGIILEKILILKLVEQYEKARTLVEGQLSSIVAESENQKLIWELITCYRGERNYKSASCHLIPYINSKTRPAPDEAKVALDIAVGMLSDGKDECAAFRDIFRWVFSACDVETDEASSATDSESCDIDAMSCDDNEESFECMEDDEDDDAEEEGYLIDQQDMLILSPDVDIDHMTRIAEAFRSLCKLEVFISDDLISFDSDKQTSYQILYKNLDRMHMCLFEVDFSDVEHGDLCRNVAKELREYDGKCFVPFTVHTTPDTNSGRGICDVDPVIIAQPNIGDKNIDDRVLVKAVINKAFEVLCSVWDENTHTYCGCSQSPSLS